jgi:hypothetical protein
MIQFMQRTQGGEMGEDAFSAMRYRTRAAELRAEAEEIANPETKQTLLRIAVDYENLADSIDAKVRRQ